MKFDDFTEGVPFDYGDVFKTVAGAEGERWIMVGVSRRQINLLGDLTTCLTPPFRVLYVATDLSQDLEPARYEMQSELSASELAEFFESFGPMFEEDGRHALWITASNGMLVFTQHDVIYAYGPLDDYESRLLRSGLTETNFSIPAPHFHFFNSEFDGLVNRLLERYAWSISPLQEIDNET
jgi:hypothetical protein